MLFPKGTASEQVDLVDSNALLSEELVSGCELVMLELADVPRCPPGPVVTVAMLSSTICRLTTSDRRRFRLRIASTDVLPEAFMRSR